jgi:ATP-dependent Clp protease adaptor protein ClpS
LSIKTEYQSGTELSIALPKKYKVFLLNDDYTSMDFVVDILMNIFHKNYNQAEIIMLDIHKRGQGLCGVYSFEIAETKVMQVHKLAREQGFPLKASMEEE